MNEPGYIYILINPSIDGMVKIGKTTRDPDSRAKELSQATGVATPFYVAFSIEVADCHSAEDYVHEVLEWNGFKRAPNREFFQMTLRDAIEVLMAADRALKEHHGNESRKMPATDGAPRNDGDELAAPVKERHPGRDVFEMAAASYFGFGDTIQDKAEAIKLLHQSRAMNFPAAYTSLAEYYADEQDYDHAFSILREGAAKGHGRCLIKMAWLFHQKQERENAAKCWKQYFKSQTFLRDDDQKWTSATDGFGLDDCEGLDPLFDAGWPRTWHAQTCLSWAASGYVSLDAETIEILSPLRDEIIADLRTSIKSSSGQLTNGTDEEKRRAQENIVHDRRLMEFIEKML